MLVKVRQYYLLSAADFLWARLLVESLFQIFGQARRGDCWLSLWTDVASAIFHISLPDLSLLWLKIGFVGRCGDFYGSTRDTGLRIE
jgi:hypothetical protein